jgi:hypothetical protein
MMKRTFAKPAVTLLSSLVLVLFAADVYGKDAARDLRRMKGFTIVDAATVSKVVSTRGEKQVVLDNGLVFKVDSLFLDPLPFTDVIVFAKPLPKEIADRFRSRLPDSFLYEFKLLIDNEAFDATRVR